MAAAVALALGGCGGSDSSTPAAGIRRRRAAANPPMATVVTHRQGRRDGPQAEPPAVPARTPRTSRAEVGKAVDAWFDGGFVGVDYPTTSFPDAFTTFTAQAKARRACSRRR